MHSVQHVNGTTCRLMTVPVYDIDNVAAIEGGMVNPALCPLYAQA